MQYFCWSFIHQISEVQAHCPAFSTTFSLYAEEKIHDIEGKLVMYKKLNNRIAMFTIVTVRLSLASECIS